MDKPEVAVFTLRSRRKKHLTMQTPLRKPEIRNLPITMSHPVTMGSVVFKNSPNKAAAWKLIAWLSSPQVQAEFHALTGDLPPRRSPWLTPALADDPYAKAFREQLERAVSTPKVPEWERIATEMRLYRVTADFGQSLGFWGVPPGPYVVLPILGPSTVRDITKGQCL